MRIVSWNMYCYNKSFEKAVDFVRSHDADVICLQEVPTAIARKLKKLPNMFFVEAKARHHGRRRLKTRNVIISKHPLKGKGGDIFSPEKRRSIRSRITGLCGPLEFQYVDVKANDKKVRVFNSHLECNTSPRVRAEQFRQVLRASHENHYNVYCGDLNVYGKWYINIFIGLLSNYSLGDFSTSERKMFEALFKEHKLHNVFYGHVTYPLFRLQLDHILVPDDMEVVSKYVYKKRFGSDHRPIEVELAL